MAGTAMQRQAAIRAKAFGDTHSTADRRQVKITPRNAAKGARKIRKAHKRVIRPVKPFRWHV